MTVMRTLIAPAIFAATFLQGCGVSMVDTNQLPASVRAQAAGVRIYTLDSGPPPVSGIATIGPVESYSC
jgi:hypothetical protein